MMSKRFRFKFKQPITCYGEIITEDVIIAADLKKAMSILKREHHYAKVDSVEVTDIELYTSSPRLVGEYKRFDHSMVSGSED
jgi:hypothetical protein